MINLKTAKALGLTIPQPLLLRANEVIQYGHGRLPNHVKLCNVQRARPRDASDAAVDQTRTIDAYMHEATTDDYNHLLQKTLRYVVVVE